MSDEAVIVFKAAMPAIQTALRISGDGNGARLLLDIPEIEMDAVAALLAMRREELIVTVQRAVQQQAKSARVVERTWKERKRA